MALAEKKTTKLVVLGRVFEIEVQHDKDAVRLYVRGGEGYSSVSATITDPLQLRALADGLREASLKLAADLKAAKEADAALERVQ